MAINVSQAFKRTSANPVDESLTLTKAQMLAINDNLQPNKYFAICLDDGELYIYDKSATPNAETGKFKKYGGGHAVEDSEGTTLTQRDVMQFGDGFTVSDDLTNEKTVVEPTLMSASDMDDVVDPLPSVRSGYHRYSTDEQVVGEWIDGKTVYEKTFYNLSPGQCEKNGDTAHVYYPIGANVDTLVSASTNRNLDRKLYVSMDPEWALISNDNIYKIWVQFYTNNADANKNTIDIGNQVINYNTHKINVTIRYTKSTT